MVNDGRKAEFTTDLITKLLPHDNAMLMDKLVFYSAELGQSVVAPTGFITDWASIPLILTGPLQPKRGPWDWAAVIHDAAYRLQLVDVLGRDFRVNKQTADYLFREGLKAMGVGVIRRTLMYWAVSKFGHGQFAEKRMAARATDAHL